MWGFGRSTTTIAFMLSKQQQQQHHHNRRLYHGTSLAAATKYILSYNYVPDVLEKRGPYREDHLKLANNMIESGKCLSGGPSGEVGMKVPTGAFFIFTDLDAAKEYVKMDPYVSGGIVTSHAIQEWNVVVGE